MEDDEAGGRAEGGTVMARRTSLESGKFVSKVCQGVHSEVCEVKYGKHDVC